MKKGDRLAVYIEEAPGAIAYKFDGRNPMALSNSVHMSSPHAVGDVVAFDPLTFPYDFSLAAYIDTDTSRYNDSDERNPDCPRTLALPDYVEVTLGPRTTLPPPTGRPGATGERGEAGERGEPGLVGATGEQGVVGVVGRDGATGERGADGVGGAVGATGVEGRAGPRGPAGETVTMEYPDGQAVSDDESMFADPNFVMYLLIWLIVLTVVVVVLIVVYVVLRRRHRQKPVVRYIERHPSQLFAPSGETKPNWTDTLKEETETNYSNDTLSTRADNNTKPSYAYTNECVTEDVYSDVTATSGDTAAELKNY